MEDIETFFENPSFFKYMSSSNMLIIDMLKKYPDSDWDWRYVSQNKKITYEDMKNNSNLKWEWKWCSRNPNITWDMAKGDKNIDILWFTGNPNFKLEYFWEKPELDWDWVRLVIDHNILEKMGETDIRFLFIDCIYWNNKTWRGGGGDLAYWLNSHFNNTWNGTTFYKWFSEKLPISFLETFYKLLLQYISHNWEFKVLIENLDFSDREDITLEIIQKCPKLKWNWEKIFKRFSHELKIKSE